VRYRIPFNRTCVLGSELEYVGQAITSRHICGDGPFTKRCEQHLQQRFALGRALLTTSCTSALEIAGLLCDLKAGDEVIMPSFTFVSTANAIALRGAVPVFVDIRPDTLNLDESLVEAAVTPRTRAIWVVHYGGVACAMDEIIAIARRHGLLVVEDAAQGVFARYKGRWLGTIGALGCVSFHETKNFSCGEGGALFVNDPEMVKRAEIIREKGTNRSQFLRGQVDKYTWVDVGSSYVPSDILAAFLLGQLEAMENITDRRRQIHETYAVGLRPLADGGLLQLPSIPEECASNYHMFFILTQDIEVRTSLIQHLREAGIQATFHYVPLHSSPVGERLGIRSGTLPVTESAASRLVRLPLHYDMSRQDASDVVTEILRFYRRDTGAGLSEFFT